MIPNLAIPAKPLAPVASTTAPAFRYVGLVDDVTTCEECGKRELRATTVVQRLDSDGAPDGDVAYYGSSCAARALRAQGGGRAVLASARGAHHRTLIEAAGRPPDARPVRPALHG